MPVARLRGIVEEKGADWVIVGVGGLGLVASVPATAADALVVGQPAAFYTYLNVREDALTLYGFTTEDELGMFELLLTVSGVGPKVGLSILSTLSPDALRLAFANDEPAIVARAPGVGKRTAQKIVLDLKDKVTRPMTGLQALTMATDADSEVIEALTALGYSIVEAQRAVQKLPKDLLGVEERLRYTLSQFGS